jgi:hypothetical protein
MKIICSIIGICICFTATAQKTLSKGTESLLTTKERSKIDRLLKIDWLSYSYQYLDDNYNITIPDDDFQKGLKESEFYKKHITEYKDSLKVILFINLKDHDASRIAGLRINYTWERLGWNLLMTPSETQKIAEELNFKMPYRVKEYVQDQFIKDAKRLQILSELRERVSRLEQVTENVEELTLKQLFNRAFRYSPERLQKVKKIQANRKSPKEHKY